MLLIQIDIVGIQTSQTVLDRADDVASGRTAHEVSFPHLHREFRRYDDLRTVLSFQRLSQIFLRQATRPVNIRGIEKIDTRVQSGTHDGLGLRFVASSAEIVAPDPDHGDFKAGCAQIVVFHMPLPAKRLFLRVSVGVIIVKVMPGALSSVGPVSCANAAARALSRNRLRLWKYCGTRTSLADAAAAGRPRRRIENSVLNISPEGDRQAVPGCLGQFGRHRHLQRTYAALVYR